MKACTTPHGLPLVTRFSARAGGEGYLPGGDHLHGFGFGLQDLFRVCLAIFIVIYGTGTPPATGLPLALS